MHASGSISIVLNQDILTAESHEPGELIGGARHGVVDDDVIELVGRSEFGTSRDQAALLLLGILGVPARESADEFVPARRGEEDEAGLGRAPARSISRSAGRPASSWCCTGPRGVP